MGFEAKSIAGDMVVRGEKEWGGGETGSDGVLRGVLRNYYNQKGLTTFQ
jgi:hypothetical protein